MAMTRQGKWGLTRDGRWALVLAAVAIGLPAAVILPRVAQAPVADVPPPKTVEWRNPPPLSSALSRPLFGVAGADQPPPADAPDLVGIVGRLNVDAVAMVRGQDGSVRTLRPGEGVDGWQLRSLATDAAYFTRGAQTARVMLDAQ